MYIWDWECSSVVECLSSMWEVFGPILALHAHTSTASQRQHAVFNMHCEVAASRCVYYLIYIFVGRIFKMCDLRDFLRTQYIVSLTVLYNGRLELILPDWNFMSTMASASSSLPSYALWVGPFPMSPNVKSCSFSFSGPDLLHAVSLLIHVVSFILRLSGSLSRVNTTFSPDAGSCSRWPHTWSLSSCNRCRHLVNRLILIPRVLCAVERTVLSHHGTIFSCFWGNSVLFYPNGCRHLHPTHTYRAPSLHITNTFSCLSFWWWPF